MRSSESSVKWQKANPEKVRAERKLRYAVKCGLLIRPSTCSMCGDGGKIHSHHSDYTKPREVIWVCSLCHSDIHRQKRAELNYYIKQRRKMKIKITEALTCKRCNHIWITEISDVRQCPRCKSYKWDLSRIDQKEYGLSKESKPSTDRKKER